MPPNDSAFLVGQRFDIRVEGSPGLSGPLTVTLDNKDISTWNNRSRLTGKITELMVQPPLEDAPFFLSRDWSFSQPGRHVLRAMAAGGATQEVSFEVVEWRNGRSGVRNVILLIGDGMGVAQRTAARVVTRGLVEGRYSRGLLEMDTMQVTGLVTTSSLTSMVTDSAAGASSYATGNKAANNAMGVLPDNTDDNTLKDTDPENDRFFDNPRIENLSEYLHRTRGLNIGLVTTTDVTDATPAAFVAHTSNRNAFTRIADSYFDYRNETGLKVLMGGGRQWFEPRAEGSREGRRGTPTNARVLPSRNLVKEFRDAGYAFADTAAALSSVSAQHPQRILGLFAPSPMPTAFDKLGHGARPAGNVPMLDHMAGVAIETLYASSPKGFFLMIEASMDDYAHIEDSDRTIWEAIEFDRAVRVAKQFAERTNRDSDPNNDTLVIVTADHETGGFSLVGTSNPDPRIPRGSRDVVRTRGFPNYVDADGDGYPDKADPDSKLMIGFGAGTDRYEDWRSNPRVLLPTVIDKGRAVANPRRDGPTDSDVSSRNGTLLSGQIENGETSSTISDADVQPQIFAVHTATDIVLTASGPGALQFIGVQDNTSIFFKIMRAYGGAFPAAYYDRPWRRTPTNGPGASPRRSMKR